MKLKTLSFVLLTVFIICTFACSQPESPASSQTGDESQTQQPEQGGSQTPPAEEGGGSQNPPAQEPETPSLSFSFGQDFLTALNEAAEDSATISGTDSATYSITIKKASDGSFCKTLSGTSTISALASTPVLITDVPVDTELTGFISVITENDDVFYGRTAAFTYTDTEVQQITAESYGQPSTPRVFWDYNDRNAKVEETTESLPDWRFSFMMGSYYCWDDEETLWYINRSRQIVKKQADSPSVVITVNDCIIEDIDYDFATDRFFVTYHIRDYPSNEITYWLKVIEGTVMKSATDFLAAEGDAFEFETSGDICSCTAAVENNEYYVVFLDWYFISELRSYHYTPENGTTSASASLKATYDLSSTDLFGNYNLDENGYIEGHDARFFTDIQVINGTIYILGRQAYLTDTYYGTENGLYTRGAVFTFTCSDTAFTYEGAVGLLPVTEKQITLQSEDYYINEACSIPCEYTTTLKCGVPEKDNCTTSFYSPMKFLAIKPKKLVIADCGPVWTTTEGLFSLEKQSRIVTIDLEDFSLSAEAYDGDFGYTYPGTAFSFTVRQEAAGEQFTYYYEWGGNSFSSTDDYIDYDMGWFFD